MGLINEKNSLSCKLFILPGVVKKSVTIFRSKDSATGGLRMFNAVGDKIICSCDSSSTSATEKMSGDAITGLQVISVSHIFFNSPKDSLRTSLCPV
jgi:hypothetical protein